MLLKEFLDNLSNFKGRTWVSSPRVYEFPAILGFKDPKTGLEGQEEITAIANISLKVKAKPQHKSTRDTNLEEIGGQILPTLSFFGEIRALSFQGEENVDICGWQCSQDILMFFASHPQEMTKENAELLDLLKLWRRWHLNDLCAGSNIQKEALLTWEGHSEADYKASCNYLESIGLLEERGYKYGHAWLFERVPNEVLNQLTDIFKEEGELKNEDI